MQARICLRQWATPAANRVNHRSADSGRTWAATGTNTSPYFAPQYSLYYNSNAGELLAGGSAAVFRSTDYGDSWTLSSGKPADARFLHFKDPYLYRPGYRTLDNGYSWIKFGAALPAVPQRDMCSLLHYIFFIATDSGVYRSDHNGNSWARRGNGLPAPKTSTLRLLHGYGRYILAGYINEVYVTEDYGDTWQRSASYLPHCFATAGNGVLWDANRRLFFIRRRSNMDKR